jgi:hypothetical protein
VKTRYEKLRQAAAVIDGIPGERILNNLAVWTCGTMGCAGGWLYRHGGFGIRAESILGQEVDLTFIELARALEIHEDDARHLFASRGWSRFDRGWDGAWLSGKDIFRYRVQRFLLSEGEALESPLVCVSGKPPQKERSWQA